MTLENREVVRRWAHGLAANGVAGRGSGGTLFSRPLENNSVQYGRTAGDRRSRMDRVVLGTYLPRQRTVLLNGDGLGDPSATHWQTQVRNGIRAAVTEWGTERVRHVVVIPFAALEAASIDHESVLPIDVVADEVEETWHRYEWDLLEAAGSLTEESWTVGTTPWRRSATVSFAGNRFELIQNENRTTDLGRYAFPSVNRVDEAFLLISPSMLAQGSLRREGRDRITWFDPVGLGNAARTRELQNDRVNVRGFGNVVSGVIPSEPGYYWLDQVHHLGACLFSASDGSGRRHKFLSAFDEDEPNQMYFLAQLPDGSGVVSYGGAVLALAPPIVHQARLEGRAVFRQGDVFAVQVGLSDDEVYGMAATRVRRDLALRDLSRGLNYSSPVELGLNWPDPLPGEVRERIACPCGCGHSRWYGCGPKAKEALSIYGTGHTATEVVKTRKGTTYVRGFMHHDPHLTEPGRQREHVDVALGDGWFLAVRNTVPRRQRRVVQVEAGEEVSV